MLCFYTQVERWIDGVIMRGMHARRKHRRDHPAASEVKVEKLTETNGEIKTKALMELN